MKLQRKDVLSPTYGDTSQFRLRNENYRAAATEASLKLGQTSLWASQASKSWEMRQRKKRKKKKINSKNLKSRIPRLLFFPMARLTCCVFCATGNQKRRAFSVSQQLSRSHIASQHLSGYSRGREFGIILTGKEGRGKEIGGEFPSSPNPFTQAPAAQSTSSPGVTPEAALLDAWGLLSVHLSH